MNSMRNSVGESSYAIEAVDIVKQFSNVLANDHVSISFEKGKVHSVLGENGAGKSTLMNILYGLYRPTSGEIRIDGRTVSLNGPADAIKAGVGMVHQHFMLVDTISVLENIIVGTRQRHEPVIDFKSSRKAIEEIAQSAGLNIDISTMVESLSVGQKQRVEIIKALYRGAQILILDEPTAVLTPQETQEFFKMIERFKQQEKTILFISHKLNEVMQISDSITIMRQGRVVAKREPANTTMEELASLMVGRELKSLENAPAKPGEVVFEARNLTLLDSDKRARLRDLDLVVRSGTIVGIAGVDGNGQTELAEVITGMRPVSSGTMHMLGRDVTKTGAANRYAMGMAHVPADRNKSGALPNMSITENILLQEYNSKRFSNKGFLRPKTMIAYARRIIGEYDIRPPQETIRAGSLSGGNLQKVILGRELSRRPKFMVAVFPTRGLDVGAIEFVHKCIVQQKEEGCAILLISTELEEIFKLSDEICAIYEGELTCVKEARKTSYEDIGLYMTGAKRQQTKPYAIENED